jgi:hypothetical protein
MKEKDLVQHFDILKELIYEMSLFGFLYIDMHTKFKKYQKQLNLSPVFFTLTYRALWSSLVLSIVKVYGEGSNYKRSLPKLLNIVENNISQFSKERKAQRSNLSNDDNSVRAGDEISKESVEEHKNALLRLPIKQILLLRDNRLAHFDNIQLSELSSAQITIDQITEMLSTATNIWNYYHVAFNGNYHKFNLPKYSDFENLLSKIRSIL